MSIDFNIGSPFATTLQGIVQPKLAEYGWTTGDPEDATIFEYILLMLGNNKNEAQIASELSNDLLDLGPENAETQEFAHWLFQQIHQLTAGSTEAPQSNDSHTESPANNDSTMGQDTEMEGTADASQASIPTGPKAMRNGSGSSNGKTPRGGRMLSNLNRQMGRSDDSALHRVRGSQGSGGRINSHAREPPKGPRSDNLGRGLAAMANGRGTNNVGLSMGPNNGMNGMNMGQMGGMPGMPMPPMGQNGMPGMLTPQQQMALMQMYEQQAQMMQQIFGGQTPAPYVNPNFQNNRKSGRSSSDKSRQNFKQNLPPSTKFTKKEGDETMTDSAPSGNGDGSAMEVEGRGDPFSVLCKFNLRCSKPDCIFAHQSPAAPEGTPLDMNDTCSFGAKCMNKKCVGRHPSPAQRHQYQSEQECAFYPNCRDPSNCPYKHPTMPPCRNGADCTTPGCKFWHTSVMCKYNPCTNARCPYKHVEGQKQPIRDRVWVAPKKGEEEKKDHVSERKFVDDDAEEELILPGKSNEQKNEEVEIMT